MCNYKILVFINSCDEIYAVFDFIIFISIIVAIVLISLLCLVCTIFIIVITCVKIMGKLNYLPEPSSVSQIYRLENCCVCLENKPQVILFPCKHKVLCFSCMKQIEKSQCPICMSKVTNIIRCADTEI